MQSLYTDIEFSQAKSSDSLPLKCINCSITFLKSKRYIKDCLKRKNKNSGNFCNLTCANRYNRKSKELHSPLLVNCGTCGLEIIKRYKYIKKAKNNFCSHKCNAIYQNINKNTGFSRSKLEFFIEEKLLIQYPNLNITYNDRSAIGMELDIYIKNLNLAFELNGIVHYEPIYGKDKLQIIQQNDNKRKSLCALNHIKLHTINTSVQSRFSIESSNIFLERIRSIIDAEHIGYDPMTLS